MSNTLNYGPRLTEKEYERRIVELHSGLPPEPSGSQDREVRRRELDLTIDRRLGRDFPPARRDALWAIQQRIESRRARLMFRHLLKNLFGRSLSRDAMNLASYVVDEYATELNQPELDAFFGPDESRDPALPVDDERR